MIHIRRPTPDEVTARLRLRYVEARVLARRLRRKMIDALALEDVDGAAYACSRAEYEETFAYALAIVLNPPKRSR